MAENLKGINLRAVFLAILASGILIFCGGKELTRQKARKILIKSGKMPQPVYESVGIGKVRFPKKHGKSDLIFYDCLQNLGYIRILKKYSEKERIAEFIVLEVELTEKGRREGRRDKWLNSLNEISLAVTESIYGEESLKKEKEYWKFKVCDKVVSEVTGIVFPIDIFTGEKAAKVEYKWKFGNFTELYRCYAKGLKKIGKKVPWPKNESYDGVAYLVLYDDGWRVKANSPSFW